MSETPAGGQIIYIGHSLGTTIALMFNSKYPSEAERLFKLVILLCPAYTLTNMISPYKWAAPFGGMILVSFIEKHEFVFRLFLLENGIRSKYIDKLLRQWVIRFAVGKVKACHLTTVRVERHPKHVFFS